MRGTREGPQTGPGGRGLDGRAGPDGGAQGLGVVGPGEWAGLGTWAGPDGGAQRLGTAGSRGGGARAVRRGHGRDVTPAGSGRTRTWRPAAFPVSRRAPARRPGNEPRVRLGARTLQDAVHESRGAGWALGGATVPGVRGRAGQGPCKDRPGSWRVGTGGQLGEGTDLREDLRP